MYVCVMRSPGCQLRSKSSATGTSRPQNGGVGVVGCRWSAVRVPVISNLCARVSHVCVRAWVGFVCARPQQMWLERNRHSLLSRMQAGYLAPVLPLWPRALGQLVGVGLVFRVSGVRMLCLCLSLLDHSVRIVRKVGAPFWSVRMRTRARFVSIHSCPRSSHRARTTWACRRRGASCSSGYPFSAGEGAIPSNSRT